MESISNKTGKKFTGKFAGLAVKIGLATPSGETVELSAEELKIKQEKEAEKQRIIAEKKEKAKLAKQAKKVNKTPKAPKKAK